MAWEDTSDKRRATIQSARSVHGTDGGEEVVPTRWEKLIVNRPWVVFLGSLLVALCLCAGAILNQPKFSGGGFSALNSATQLRIDAFQALHIEGRSVKEKMYAMENECRAHRDLPTCQSDPNCKARTWTDYGSGTPELRFDYCMLADKHKVRRLAEGKAEGKTEPWWPRRLYNQMCNDLRNLPTYRFMMLYEAADGGNLLTAAHLTSICKFERVTLPAMAGYTQHCKQVEQCSEACKNPSDEANAGITEQCSRRMTAGEGVVLEDCKPAAQRI